MLAASGPFKGQRSKFCFPIQDGLTKRSNLLTKRSNLLSKQSNLCVPIADSSVEGCPVILNFVDVGNDPGKRGKAPADIFDSFHNGSVVQAQFVSRRSGEEFINVRHIFGKA